MHKLHSSGLATKDVSDVPSPPKAVAAKQPVRQPVTQSVKRQLLPTSPKAVSGSVTECRLECQSARWLNTAGACSCKHYDPHLFLPLSTFSKAEMSQDIQPAARQLLDQC